MATRKQERICSIIQRVVGTMIVSEIRDPRVGFVTVTRVELSQDGTLATVFVSVLGSDADTELTMHGLRAATSRIAIGVGKTLTSRITPKLRFKFDDAIERSARVSALIRDARSSDPNPGPLPFDIEEQPEDETDI